MDGSKRLNILYVSHLPPSPPRFGAQARIHGLMTQLAQRHDITAVILLDRDFDADECRAAMEKYCRRVILVPNPNKLGGAAKRISQLYSLASKHSFERTELAVPELQRVLDTVLRSERFDIVNLEFPYLGFYDLRQAPAGEKPPRVVVDSHEIAYDLARQFSVTGQSVGRRLYGSVNWRKLKKEELHAYGSADAIYLCSALDEQRVRQELPNIRAAVVPNAADVDYFKPNAHPAPGSEQTVVYFGLLSTIPNIDAVTYFIRDIWPSVAKAQPGARLKIVGGGASPALQALAGDRIEFTGFVPDIRPHIDGAGVIVVPLRLGGGTRLKIVEAMAMGKAIVSTSLGAEGISAVDGRDLVIEDEPIAFADAIIKLLENPELSERIGRAGRALAEAHYSWRSAANSLEKFFEQILEHSA